MAKAVSTPASRAGLGLVSLFLLALQPLLGAPQDPPKQGQGTAPFPRKGAYLGKEVCADCHEAEHEAILGGHHRDVVRMDELPGCETCHGPGQAHGEDIDNALELITMPRKLGTVAQRQFCGRCHQRQMEQHGGDPAGLAAAGKRCTDCHAVHEKRPDEQPHSGVAFKRRSAADLAADRTGSQSCVDCHPLRNELLASSHHRELASPTSLVGCESCHGAGSMHVESGGLARLITRPDRAADGAATCRSCHEEVDPVEYHWRGRRKPLLGAGLTCTTCHRVHQPSGEPAESPRSEPVEAGRSGSVEVALTVEPAGELSESVPPTNRLCAICHAPAFGVLPGTVHESLGAPDAVLANGCGACHVGAERHALSGGRKELVQSLHGSSAAVQHATCTACHDREEALTHVRTGAHHRHEVSCLSCHSPAAARGAVAADAESKCAQCHQSVAAAFRLPNHHPVPEGHMQCSSCHDPHGARRKVRDLQLREERCVSCHREYRGPFVYQHQASRRDGCTACHVPHGSSNRRLLQQVNTQQNCLQCHGDFPAFHDQSSGAVFTNCIRCHVQVHGSNHSRYLFR